jgi:hypothetical protein
MTTESETTAPPSEQPIHSANEADMRTLASELARQRSDDAPAVEPQSAEDEPQTLEDRYRSLREMVTKIEDELGISNERERTLNETKARVAELEAVVAAYTAEQDAERPQLSRPQTATILSPNPNHLIALKRS